MARKREITTGDEKADELIEAVADAVFACGEWDDEDLGTYDSFVEVARKARRELADYLRGRLQPTVNGDANG